ncbi:MAG: Curculin domain protein (Mannose-binding) lectin [candidate division CPR1 bacterium GW2011_GWA2_42_17]|uniref:Curculin domain protein (Mannose-binding) lectin n=1 Tax=candidate division CPR1 bacterium GW2011_GWA2_42_17 TaxID=1618341 RepID=A0A0G0Z740_9BACT|nr:MAG: Curculin domain protein (Mannose-binding) lectin [candidate division CPR1 bacterium GW2011_GWA2_42_17]
MIKSFLTIFSLFLISAAPFLARAQIDYNTIISDAEFYNTKKFGLSDIADFLSRQLGALKTFFDPISGRTAAQIIFEAGRDWQINPQTLIVTLQKEQSLIEDGNPSTKQYDWATGYGICDSCSMDDPGLQKFRGFTNQVNFAARLFRRYFDNPNLYGIKIDESKIIDGLPIVPTNKATASLFVYTPHLHGNENFRKIWDRYFTLGYPDGAFVQLPNDEKIYLIQNGQKRLFKNRSIFLARASDRQILEITASDLNKYPDGAPINFSPYSLVRTPPGTVFLILNENLKRGFASQNAFKKLGFNPEEIDNVTVEDLADIPEGPPLTEKVLEPIGQLLQNGKTGGVALLRDNYLHPIWSREILKNNFNMWKIKVVTEKIWQNYPLDDAIMFKEGTLIKVKGESAVYVISNNFRRPFADEKSFTRLGYKWENIIETSSDAVGLHLIGEPIKIN